MEDDYHARMDFCQQTILNITGSFYFLEELTFADEAASHISGKFNGQQVEKGETSRCLATLTLKSLN